MVAHVGADDHLQFLALPLHLSIDTQEGYILDTDTELFLGRDEKILIAVSTKNGGKYRCNGIALNVPAFMVPTAIRIDVDVDGSFSLRLPALYWGK